MKKQLQQATKILFAMDEHFACEGCDVCPFKDNCEGIDKNACVINNALTNIQAIVNLPQDTLQNLLATVTPFIEE
jgi:hypothetical protein